MVELCKGPAGDGQLLWVGLQHRGHSLRGYGIQKGGPAVAKTGACPQEVGGLLWAEGRQRCRAWELPLQHAEQLHRVVPQLGERLQQDGELMGGGELLGMPAQDSLLLDGGEQRFQVGLGAPPPKVLGERPREVGQLSSLEVCNAEGGCFHQGLHHLICLLPAPCLDPSKLHRRGGDVDIREAAKGPPQQHLKLFHGLGALDALVQLLRVERPAAGLFTGGKCNPRALVQVPFLRLHFMLNGREPGPHVSEAALVHRPPASTRGQLARISLKPATRVGDCRQAAAVPQRPARRQQRAT
mmetsp:Transcript_7677/g.21847  ORF Transcript_7677/g.21847 Transcript_7677/m.21847 type:complete len:298 (-) Transcript_7677:92-985(-)